MELAHLLEREVADPLVPPQRLDLLTSPRFDLVVLTLQVQPEVRWPLESLLERQRSRRRDGAFPVADLADRLWRQAGAPREIPL